MAQGRMKTGEKILFGIFGFFLLASIGIFVLLEVISQQRDTPMYPISSHYDFTEEGLRGSQIFRSQNCTACHRAMRNGTNMGLNLDGLGSVHDYDYFYNFLKNPEKNYAAQTIDHGAPPKEAAYVATLPDADLRAIARFLSQLRTDRGGADAPLPPEGQSTFIDTMLKYLAPDRWKKNPEPYNQAPAQKENRDTPQ
jgi:cytochrome c553